MNYFSYPLTIVQINIFEEPQNIFSQPKSQTPNYRASPPVFLTIECPPGNEGVQVGMFTKYQVLKWYEAHAADDNKLKVIKHNLTQLERSKNFLAMASILFLPHLENGAFLFGQHNGFNTISEPDTW